MRRIAVTTPYFDFFPDLRDELEASYPGTKFRSDRRKLTEDELIDYLKGYDTALIGLERFNDRVCQALPELKTLSLCSAGVDHIDPAILNRYGIKMWWAAGINKVSVAELTVCYMVLTVRRVHYLSSVLRRGEWAGPLGYGHDLRGRTVGIHGCGHIGKEVVKLLQPYGVRILIGDRVAMPQFCAQWNAEQVEAEEMWAHSDIVSLHLPRNATTLGMYTDAVLGQMKPGALLINCARGGLVDEAALKRRMDSGHIAGAAFDVFAVEPANNNPLVATPTMFASPHIGATTREGWGAMLRSGMRGVTEAYAPEPGVYPFD